MPLSTHISNYEIVITIITATILFLMLVSFSIAFLFTYQKRKGEYYTEKQEMETMFKQELLKSQLETQEYSFQQVSREIHDNIGQLLSSTKMLMSVGFMELSTVPDALKIAEQTVIKAIQDLRLLSKSLNQEWLHQFNLIENLEAEKERINSSKNITVELISQYDKLPLEPEAQVMLFRVVQEALQNSIKHANAKNIVIQIQNTDNCFELSIKDDGKGFDVDVARKASLGLRNMEYRIQLLGGSIEWKSEKEIETEIRILVPCK
ncbi:MAG TPA: ATP-binding protein [Parafilimonas sp.]|jgi:signal transduction histidine kinase